jgi:hypothetical protein
MNLYQDRINLLYNYFYNENLKKNYEIEKINLDKINETDYEFEEGKLSNNILNELLENKFQYLFVIDDDIYYKIYSDNISSIMKLSFNKKSWNDNKISYLLSELVLEDKTSNILLPVVNISVNIQKIKHILIKNVLSPKFEKYIDKKKNISLKIREGFFNLITLRSFINSEHTFNYKSILFRILYTLLIIKNKFKYFMHNNLTLDNIFIYINPLKLSNNEKYIIDGQVYIVPNENIAIKITNFEDSTIYIDKDNEIEEDIEIAEKNIFIEESDYNINIEDYEKKYKSNLDLIMLVKDLLKENKKIDLIIKNFLVKIIKNNNIRNILKDEYFNDYKEKHKSLIFTGNRIITNDTEDKLNIELDTDNEHIFGNQRKLNRIYMKGGYDKTIAPPYKNEPNNPFRTNDEKQTFNKKIEDLPKKIQQPVLLEQTIYDTTQKPNKQPAPAPVYIPIQDNNQLTVLPTSGIVSNMLNPAYNQPLQKVYNISLSNPLHDFSTVSALYEDILPGDPRTFTFGTTYERIQLSNFIRNLINDNIDGEDMNVTGGKNSILSSMKLLDLNPYSLNKHPYKDLGKNYLLYRAAYPIRYDKEKNSVILSKSAQGFNARLYNISFGEMNGDEIRSNLTNFDFDLWRDLYYYRYITDKIVSKKISPNFITMILYKIDKSSKINWNKLSNLQHKNMSDKDYLFRPFNKTFDDTSLTIFYFKSSNDKYNKEFDKLKESFKDYKNIVIKELESDDVIKFGIQTKINITKFPSIVFKLEQKFTLYDKSFTSIVEIVDFINAKVVNIGKFINLNAETGQSLVLITEAPHTNIIRWASPVYEANGSLKKMIATGYHKKEVWQSILFQLIHLLHILQEQKIYFEELSLENNIYIKDLNYDPNNINYWIYNVDGLDYYVPNYGYLVLFDSKYSDLKQDDFNPREDYKILSPILFENKNDKTENKKDIDFAKNYDKLNYDKFKSIFDPTTFTNYLKKQGGLVPDDDIINLIRLISNDSSQDIKYYIRNYFNFYLNNRIGKPLMRSEKEIINIYNRPLYRKGELIVKQERFDDFKWVLFEEMNVDGTINIINRDIRGIITVETIPQYCLYGYPISENISPIDEKNIIETFKSL